MVSVVITCYNYGHYLASSIESVLSQTYRAQEIIVVNDGSTDDTDEVIQQFLTYKQVKYVKQKNAGQANAKNTGISAASGDFIAFLDADDFWERTKLEKQVPFFRDRSIGVVYSKARYINDEGASISLDLPGKYLKNRSGNVTNFLFLDNFVPFSSSIVRLDCLKEFGGFDESLKMGIDWDLWLRISTKYRFDYVDECLLVYRVGHPHQMSKNVEERHRSSDRIMTSFLDRYPNSVSPSVVREAMSYTCCNRGYYFRHSDKKKSNLMYLSAIRYRPLNLTAYKGLLRNTISIFSGGLDKAGRLDDNIE